MSEVPYEYWAASFMISGSICLLIGLLYSVFIWKDLHSSTPKLPGYKSSQIFFIFASLLRGIGWIAQSILFIIKKNDFTDNFGPITVGIPGYILTISYVLLFYLWSSICVNLIANDSTSYLKETVKHVVNIILTIIATLGFVLVIMTTYRIESEKDNKSFHFIEATTALARDFITASMILFFTCKIIKMSEKSICSSKSNESIYCWMLICIIVALYFRSLSLALYLFLHIKDFEKSLLSYLNTFITAIVSEILPCAMIFFNRRRSGLLSVYDLIE